MTSPAILDVRGLQSGYGDVQVLWDVGFSVVEGEVACIVGSNGAGKTTLLRTLSGLVPSRAGRVSFCGRDLTGASPAAVLSAGIAHVPEGRRLFKGLSVRDNLLLGAYLRQGDGNAVYKDLEYVFSIFPILAERQRQDASTLSGGEQQMCAIGRGIMSRPKLLMIDELSLGLAPRAVERLSEALREINARGITVLLVEQDVMTAFELASAGFVIDMGRVTRQGPTAALADDLAVRAAYMGL